MRSVIWKIDYAKITTRFESGIQRILKMKSLKKEMH